jgi:putative hydrolase of the HAD superfamily
MQIRRHLLRPAARLRRSRRTATAVPTRLWLFDLDNTLHNCSHAIFPRIDVGMTRAVAQTLGVDEETASAVRTKYWKRYGATVIGMVRHHGVNADDFLRMSHDFDVGPLIKAETGLPAKLRRLPGRKVLLTNAPLHYARAVLRHLGLLGQFDSLWAIEHMNWHGNFRPKPSATLLRRVLAREGVAAAHTVLVEDTLENLRGARRAGLRTVHINHPGTPFSKGGRNRPGYVDLRVNSVSELLLQRRPVRR